MTARVQAMYFTPHSELWLKDKLKSKVLFPSACGYGGATGASATACRLACQTVSSTAGLPRKKAQQIELDMLSGNFDPTLQKYKPEDPLPMVVAGSEASQSYTDVFKQHWDEFVDDKGQRLESPFTIVSMYNPIPKKVRNFGRKILGRREAQEFVTFMLQSASPATIKKQVIILNDFGNWVQQNKLVDAGWENPFTGLTEMCHPVPPA